MSDLVGTIASAGAWLGHRKGFVDGGAIVRKAERLRIPVGESTAVVLHLEPSPELVVLLLAAIMRGTTPILWPARVRLPSWLSSLPRVVFEGCGSAPATSDWQDWHQRLNHGTLVAGEQLRTPVGIGVCSSGSAGRGKTVILDCERALANAREIVEQIGHKRVDATLALRHPAYSAGFVGDLLVSALIGQKVMFPPASSIGLAARTIRGAGVRGIHCTPASLERIWDILVCAELERVVLSGAAAPVKTIVRLLKMGVSVWVGYGVSEAGPRVTMLHADKSYEFGDCGYPLKGVKVGVEDSMVVIDSAYSALSVIDGDGIKFRRGVRIIPGDIGKVFDDGRIRVTGRAIECVMIGDVPIPVAEVEELLRASGIDAVVSLSSASEALRVFSDEAHLPHVRQRIVCTVRRAFPFLPKVVVENRPSHHVSDAGKVVRF